MKLTRDESYRLRDAFEEFLESLIGDDVHIRRGPDEFHIEFLGKKTRNNYKDKKLYQQAGQ